MQKSTSTLSQKFLKKIENISRIEEFDTLIELLESTNDPDPSELYLLESLYQLKEKLVLAESRLNSYVVKNKSLTGNKLDELYESESPYGSSILFR